MLAPPPGFGHPLRAGSEAEGGEPKAGQPSGPESTPGLHVIVWVCPAHDVCEGRSLVFLPHARSLQSLSSLTLPLILAPPDPGPVPSEPEQLPVLGAERQEGRRRAWGAHGDSGREALG